MVDLDVMTKKLIMHIANNHNNVLIIDASYHLHKFAYVHRVLSINDGNKVIPTGHLYGFMRMLCFVKRVFGNPAIIIAVDGYDKERKMLNNEYKAGRPEKEVKVHDFTEDIIKMSAMLDGVYVSYDRDYEADDTIYVVSRTLDELFKKNGIDRDIYIYAQDKDLMQCVNDKIKMIRNFGKGKDWLKGADIVDVDGVREKFDGVRPDRIAMFRSIAGGDSADNIKGYLRFKKKAASIIAEECIIGEDGIKAPNTKFFFDNPGIENHLKIINDDYSKFMTNYKIMKMKEYNFTLRIPEKGNAMELIDYYKLNSYKKELALFESLKNEESGK